MNGYEQSRSGSEIVTGMMRKLGFDLRVTPTGITGWRGPGTLRGENVAQFVTNSERTREPRSFDEPVWVGYYEMERGGEMLDDAQYASLAEFLVERQRSEKAMNLEMAAKGPARKRQPLLPGPAARAYCLLSDRPGP